MTARSAFGAGILVGELIYFAVNEILPRLLVPRLARKWL